MANGTKRRSRHFIIKGLAETPTTGAATKRDYEGLVRRCGFGVPDLDRALWSVANSLTMVVEERLHPFKREGSKLPTLRDMHLYNLPWPREALESLGETPVEMRVTLSYFHRAQPVATRRPFAVPIRVSWSPFRRQAAP